ncbi:MAG: AraC family transcriptional regulator [Pseudomonadota bacterium]
MKSFTNLLLTLLLVIGVASANDEDSVSDLDTEIQTLKQTLLDINRDLYILEEDLLFPASTQISVFVSMDVGTFFALDSVQLTIDGTNTANYLYTPRETEALLRGGVQRLFTGNLTTGEHELIAIFTGIGPNGREYRRGSTMVVEKELGPKYVELIISDRQSKEQPEFVIKEW